jgi:hypothetical protein
MVTILTAAIGVFIVLGVWCFVDQLAKKRLGERPHGCSGHGSGAGCGSCKTREDCEEASEEETE